MVSIKSAESLDWRIFKNIVGALLILVVAMLAPFFSVAIFDVWKPGVDTLGQWFERSGAIITIYSAIAAAISKVSLDLISQSKEISAREASALTRKYTKTVHGIESVSLLVTLVGALIWGYGSFILNNFLKFEAFLNGLHLLAIC